MKKHLALMSASVFIFAVLSSIFIVADGMENFTQAEQLIKSKVQCSQLSSEQLEIIGEYYMEQMHPGELHEIMDQRMGGDGSESLRQVHINITLNFYCGEHQYGGRGMMNMIMGRGMVYGTYNSLTDNSTTINSSYVYFTLAVQLLGIIALVLFIIWMVKKLRKNTKRR